MAGKRARIKAREVEDLGFQCSSSESYEERPKTVVQPSKFFGEPGEDVEKWLKSFERISRQTVGLLCVREMYYLLF